MQKLFLPPPLNCFAGGFWGGVLGILIRFRMLPFLKPDTILSGGKQVPTEQFALFGSNFFYGGAVVFFALGLVSVLTLTDARRRYIAQLPRRQRWMYWPFVTAASAGPSADTLLFESIPEPAMPDLPTALRRYWFHLLGVASFASIMTLFNPPIYLVPALFFGAAFLALWPVITKRAPFGFWIVAGAVWMGGAILAAILGAFVRR